MQLLTDSESGDKNYEQVHLHPLDIDLLQRSAAAASRHSLGATRPNRRRRSQNARPPIAPIKIKLRMPAATTASSTQSQPPKQGRGSSLSAVLAEIVREPLKTTPTTLVSSVVWTPSLKPAVAHHPAVQAADETTPNRRGLVETVASIREFYATEFCHQLLKEIAAEAILEAETHRQEEFDSDLKKDGSFGPSQSELGPENLDAAIAIPACLSFGLLDRAEEEPLHEKLEGVETPCHDEGVMNNTDEAKSPTGHSLDSALLEANQTLLSKGVVDSSAEPPIVVKIAKIHVHPPEGGTSSNNKAALSESPSRALRSSASSQDSVATAEKMTGQSKNEGSLKVVISPSKQTVLPPTKDSKKTILLKVKGRKLLLEKGEVASKGRKKLHSSIQKRKAPRGRVVKRRRVRQRGKEKEPVTEEVVPEKVSYVTVLKMSEIVSMRPAAAAGGGGGRGKIIQKLASSMENSGLNRFQETKSIAETTTEEILNAGKGETLLEKLPESEPSPTPEGTKQQAQPEAPQQERPEVSRQQQPEVLQQQQKPKVPQQQRPEVQQQQKPEVTQQERPEAPKQPQDMSQLDSGCLPELEDEFIQDLPVLSYPPVPLPLSNSGLSPGTIPVAVEPRPGKISVGPLQSNKKKKKKKAKKSPSPPPSKAQQLPVMRKSQAEIILAKIPPTAPAAAAAPLPSSRRGSTSGSGQKNREHWVTSPPPAAPQPDFVARKSRPDETVTFCLPEGGFLRAPPTPLYRRVDELFGQYYPAETATTVAEEKAFEQTAVSSALVSDVLSDLVETVCGIAQRSTGNQRVTTAAPHQEWRSEESRPEEGNNREVESQQAGQQTDGESSNNSTQCGQGADSGSKQENLPALGDFENKKIHESKGGNSDSQKVAVAELPEEQPAPASEETNGGQVRRIRKSSSLSESNTTEETAAQARRNRMKHTG